MPIHLSEYITSTSLIAAHSSINVLSVIFPGSSDASFSLASFIDLVRREWTARDNMPERQHGITQVARAIVGWSSLQGVTQEWQERQWLKYLREIDVKEPAKASRTINRRQDIYSFSRGFPNVCTKCQVPYTCNVGCHIPRTTRSPNYRS